MIVRGRYGEAIALFATTLFVTWQSAAAAGPPSLSTIFPPGGRVGQAVEVAVQGTNLQGLQTLRCNLSGVQCENLEPNRFRLIISPETPCGLCDIWAVSADGISAPRTFVIGNRAEQNELESAEQVSAAASVPLDVSINGRIDKPADIDSFQFTATRGQCVVIECWAERIDSRLRAVLEIFDASGRRIATNRGYYGIDPLIDFRVPEDGTYVVKVHDLVSAGGPEHYYRLDIDTRPRVAFSIPRVIQRNTTSNVTLYGWNLSPVTANQQSSESGPAFDHAEMTIPATHAIESGSIPCRFQPSQAAIADSSLAWQYPDAHTPVVIGLTDVPVVLDSANNHSPSTALALNVPCEVSGQLVVGNERDWYSIEARRGEVLHLEAFGERIQSPVDLDLEVFDSTGDRQLLHLADEVRNLGETCSTSHLDPAGRWVCPADGRYLIMVRTLVGSPHPDPRRTYRLNLRREEFDFHLLAVPRTADPMGLYVARNGRTAFDLLAIRRLGFEGAVRISARNLPLGVECPDVWIGPNVDRATMVVSADQHPEIRLLQLQLEGSVEGEQSDRRRTVHGVTSIRTGIPSGWSRLTSQIPVAIQGEAPVSITADCHEPLQHHLYGKLHVRHSPGGVLDVAVQVQRRNIEHQASVKLTGIGLPPWIQGQTSIIPAGQQKGYLSFYLPASLPVGRYSFVIQAETTVPTADGKTASVVVPSDPVTFDVEPAGFLVEVDPFSISRARRGETIKIGYSARRLNGFIGKMHTELAVPGHVTDIPGIRGRGATFVGQSDKGTLQIVVNDDAPLGQAAFLRLYTVGVIEDEPVYHGSSFLPLEIVE